jgi:hypothetical protein
MKNQTATVNELQAVARHALACGVCKVKVRHLVHASSPVERNALLGQIEWHHYRSKGGQAC